MALAGVTLASVVCVGEVSLNQIGAATHAETTLSIMLMALGGVSLAFAILYTWSQRQHSPLRRYGTILGLGVLLTCGIIAIYGAIIFILFMIQLTDGG